MFFPPLWDQIEEAFYPAAEAGRDGRRLDAARGRMAELHAELDTELEGRAYLCDEFTVADIANFVMLSAAATMGAPPDPALESLAAWLSRTAARPAVAREIAAMQAYVASLQAPSSAAS